MNWVRRLIESWLGSMIAEVQMCKTISQSLRAALDDPATRYRIAEAWRLRKKTETAKQPRLKPHSNQDVVAVAPIEGKKSDKTASIKPVATLPADHRIVFKTLDHSTIISGVVYSSGTKIAMVQRLVYSPWFDELVNEYRHCNLWQDVGIYEQPRT